MAVTVADPEPGTPHQPSRTRRFPRAWLLRLAAALVSGFAYYLSFAPRPLWWLAPLAFAGFALVLRGRSFRGAFGYGFAFGFVFFLPLLTWLLDFLGPDFGPWPWLGLSFALALYYGLAGGLITLVARLPLAPLWGALVFIALETPRAWFPFGGFPWGRVAFSQPEGAFLPLASIGGAPLVGLAVVGTGFALAALAARLWDHRKLTRPAVLAALGTVLPVVAGLALWPAIGTGAQDGERTIATVQGNAPDIGLALQGERELLRRNTIAESQRLLDAVRTGKVPKPDLVLWPESATTVTGPDPQVDQLVANFGVPALIGALYELPDGHIQNSVIAWDPHTGPGQRYAKQQLVPFGEYVPARKVAELVTPFLDSETVDMLPGDGTNQTLAVAGTKVGVFVCYEAAFDYPARDAVRDGAEVLVVPTNNAWYGESEMSVQQLAMSRLRAVEHGRAIVVSAVSGVSAIVAPDGTVTSSTGLFTADSLVGRIPLRTQTTLSDRLGAWTEYGLLALAIAGVAGGLVLRFRTRRASAGTAAGEAAD
ncbi:apolipoprotein N-acyltransferase [Amycolatopsis lexingtonensis]|uniref:Apolipoprotein N-acyltransferase n=1 Tax=Amycolatopsis lexingtonensis TaxID=218822 RepID=A0ABR9HV99_9PSEU|nr:apolipoprotein N-acyltransferase [Amycolatopsis lexingtonensis]MBE1494856.1 apolipoprotein N-acyltransferase [Amycolatopsis lexingtonensis]